MADPLGTTASVVTLTDRALAVLRWAVGWLPGGKRPKGSLRAGGRHPHNGLEILPVGFEVYVGPGVPHVVISLYAINYTKSPLLLVSCTASQLFIGGGPALDNVSLVTEFDLPAMSSQGVFLRRNLADSEARAVIGSSNRTSPSGSIQLIARAEAGKKQIKYGPVSALAINGRFEGLPPGAA
jgi:hypothetical protein